ncbi:MAG: type II secretion system protein [Anaerolineales bacterium]
MTHPLLSARSSLHDRWRALVTQSAGFSLVEELVALAVIALGVMLLISMISTGAVGVTTQTDHMVAEALARSQLERVKDAAYSADPTAAPYPTEPGTAPYSVALDVEYWDSGLGDFSSTMTASGSQRVTATVSRNGQTVLSLADVKVDR